MDDQVVSFQWKAVYTSICFTSMVFSSIIPIIYVKSKRSRHHPAIIIVNICIAEMISSWHLLIWAVDLQDYLQYFDVYEFWDWWLLKSLPSISLDNTVFCYGNLFVYFSTLIFEQVYYCILCIDLIITLKMPFISGSRRIVYYFTGAALVGVTTWLSLVPSLVTYCKRTSTYTDVEPVLYIAYPQITITEIVFYVIGTVSIILSIGQIRKCNYDSYLQMGKTQYLINHVAMIVIIFIAFSVPLINNLIQYPYNFINELNDTTHPKYDFLNNISFCILLSQGMFLGMIRLRDPYFRMRTKVLLMSCIGRASRYAEQVRMMESEDDRHLDGWNQTLAALVSRAQNQEVVSQILQGVIIITRWERGQVPKQYNDKNIKQWVNERKKRTFKPYQISATPYKDSFFEGEELKEMRVTEYAPKVFQILRETDGIPIEVLVKSLNPKSNYKQIMSAQESMGKSGSFFFFSKNKKLILKTITPTELDVLIGRVLYSYTKHIELNSGSTLARIYGAYEVQLDGVSPIKLILMENTLHGIKELTSLYDLKGSLVNRYVHRGPSQSENSNQTLIIESETIQKSMSLLPTPSVLKDQNFLASDNFFITLDRQVRDTLLEQLKKDTDFLLTINIMDYSMLLGIGSATDSTDPKERVVYDTDGQVMSFRLIDYLQRYDWLKRLEFHYKTQIKLKHKYQISCILPPAYQSRFLSFINSVICILN